MDRGGRDRPAAEGSPPAVDGTESQASEASRLRRRLARHLHDEVAQTLCALSLDPSVVSPELDRAIDALNALCLELDPPPIRDLSTLCSTIKAILRRYPQVDATFGSLSASARAQPLNDSHCRRALRVVQEALDWSVDGEPLVVTGTVAFSYRPIQLRLEASLHTGVGASTADALRRIRQWVGEAGGRLVRGQADPTSLVVVTELPLSHAS